MATGTGAQTCAGCCWMPQVHGRSHPALFAPHSICACYLSAFLLQCLRKSSLGGHRCDAEGTFWSAWKVFATGLVLHGRKPSGEGACWAGEGGEQERAGEAAGREGRQVAGLHGQSMEVNGSNMSAWFGVRRCSKVMGMRENPISQQHHGLQKSSSWALRATSCQCEAEGQCLMVNCSPYPWGCRRSLHGLLLAP